MFSLNADSLLTVTDSVLLSNRNELLAMIYIAYIACKKVRTLHLLLAIYISIQHTLIMYSIEWRYAQLLCRLGSSRFNQRNRDVSLL